MSHRRPQSSSFSTTFNHQVREFECAASFNPTIYVRAAVIMKKVVFLLKNLISKSLNESFDTMLCKILQKVEGFFNSFNPLSSVNFISIKVGHFCCTIYGFFKLWNVRVSALMARLYSPFKQSILLTYFMFCKVFVFF